jgi:hypothetical protein
MNRQRYDVLRVSCPLGRHAAALPKGEEGR